MDLDYAIISLSIVSIDKDFLQHVRVECTVFKRHGT